MIERYSDSTLKAMTCHILFTTTWLMILAKLEKCIMLMMAETHSHCF